MHSPDTLSIWMMLRCRGTYLAVDGPADKVLFIHRMKVQGSHEVCMPAHICMFTGHPCMQLMSLALLRRLAMLPVPCADMDRSS